ncbi:hypothetical protein ZHAS_00011825 [Anopheles sinensis]|uniref:Uncharacterized protein n=1 Tax=Anopheles sinensis TaxID=74873 RepID=A0A084W1A2_ANOSI|nr:hypothetical protein ZHAS_00011825 [Anopheles sinensis]
MLKWVVTRAPREVCHNTPTPTDTLWDFDKENLHPHQPCGRRNDYIIHPKPATSNEYDKTTSSPPAQMGGKRKSDMRDMEPSSPSIGADSTLSSFRYFLVNDHSSPLKRQRCQREPRESSLYTASPLPSFGHCSTPQFGSSYHRTKPQRSRRRVSSLHIREPTELASPSYRPADDPANDLVPTDCAHSENPEREIRWHEVLDMLPTESTVRYNEREIKTPETEKRSDVSQGDQLVRRKAVRRRKCPKPVDDGEHQQGNVLHSEKNPHAVIMMLSRLP